VNRTGDAYKGDGEWWRGVSIIPTVLRTQLRILYSGMLSVLLPEYEIARKFCGSVTLSFKHGTKDVFGEKRKLHLANVDRQHVQSSGSIVQVFLQGSVCT
jgi:hypothetical protein